MSRLWGKYFFTLKKSPKDFALLTPNTSHFSKQDLQKSREHVWGLEVEIWAQEWLYSF